MSTTTYARRKAAGLCGYCGLIAPQHGRVSCRPCQHIRGIKAQHERDSRPLTFIAPRPRGLQDALTHYPGPLLAHCGTWWPIAPDQVACGTCGVTYAEAPASPGREDAR